MGSAIRWIPARCASASDVLQAVRFGHLAPRLGAGRFLKGRGLDLGKGDDVLYRTLMLGGESGDGGAISLARHDLADNRLGVTGHGMASPAASAR